MSNYAQCCSCRGDADTDLVLCTECDAKFTKNFTTKITRLKHELTKARRALQLASNDTRLQSSGQDDYVLCQVRSVLGETE